MNMDYVFNVYGKTGKILKKLGCSDLIPDSEGKINVWFKTSYQSCNPEIVVKESIKECPVHKEVLDHGRKLVRQIINGTHELYYSVWESKEKNDEINSKIRSIFSGFRKLFSSEKTWNEFQDLAEVYTSSGYGDLDNWKLHDFIDINGMICNAIKNQKRFSDDLYKDMADFKVFAGGSHDSGPFIKLKNLGDYMELRPDFKPVYLENIYKWKVKTNSYPYDEKDIKGLLCPDCVEKQILEDYKSENIYTRTYAGYYKDHPEQFKDDALKYFNLEKLPNKDKIYSKAVENGYSEGYSGILNQLCDLSEIFN